MPAPRGPYTDPAQAAANAAATAQGQSPANGADQVSGIITYTYYAGTKPNGKPLPGPPVDAGTYTVVATFRSADGNYTGGSAATTFTIQKATPNINLRGQGGTYNGAPFPVSGMALTNSPGAMSAEDAPGPRVDVAGVPIPTAAARGGKRPLLAQGPDLMQVSGSDFQPPTVAEYPAEVNPMPPAGPEPARHPLTANGVPANSPASPQMWPHGAQPAESKAPDGDGLFFEGTSCTAGARFWFGGEYLMWFIKGSPLPFPLITTSTNPGTNVSGALGQPGTAVLYGGDDIDFGLFSGLRLTGGAWIDDQALLGVQGEVFFLQSHSDTFSAGSNNAGTPPLYLPAFNTQLQAERALIVADPISGLAGTVNIASSSELWGAEVAGVLNCMRTNNLSIDLLGGFRYLDLDESLVLTNTTRDLDVGIVDALRDQFETTNQFYGALFGTRICCNYGPWHFSVSEKLAFGSTRDVIAIAGSIDESGANSPSPGTFLGGFFAQPTNIGRRTDNRFSVVPEVQLKVGYRFSRYAAGFLGYNFIYWTGVVRPGDQIDRNLNLSQSPIFGTSGGVLVGTPSPRPLSNRSDFWTQGLSLGLAITY